MCPCSAVRVLISDILKCQMTPPLHQQQWRKSLFTVFASEVDFKSKLSIIPVCCQNTTRILVLKDWTSELASQLDGDKCWQIKYCNLMQLKDNSTPLITLYSPTGHETRANQTVSVAYLKEKKKCDPKHFYLTVTTVYRMGPFY